MQGKRSMNHTIEGLQRFVQAQAGVYETVLEELAMGHKESHWMWFIFPQLKELGRSAMAKHYGVASIAEARAYLAHPLLSGVDLFSLQFVPVWIPTLA